MKCPKCEYLGYDTGTRCRNCGYDFSLSGAAAGPASDLRLNEPSQTPTSVEWLDQFALDAPAAMPAAHDAVPPARPAAAAVSAGGFARERTGSPALPLFARSVPDDEPLVRLPATPRAPLAVRKTPDTPKARAAAKPVPKPADPEPAFEFPEDIAPAPEPVAAASVRAGDAPAARRSAGGEVATGVASGPAARLLAALLDHGLLLAIDATVIYFTLRVAALLPGDLTLLPPAPLVFFLGLIKVGYFASFTALGGQTLGKMAAGIAVVTDDGAGLDPGQAVKRALAGAVSLLAGGLGFLPALVASDRRALHDRVAGTRVVVRAA
jgi:uncharacterized RDD family membrane protein YckC